VELQHFLWPSLRLLAKFGEERSGEGMQKGKEEKGKKEEERESRNYGWCDFGKVNSWRWGGMNALAFWFLSAGQPTHFLTEQKCFLNTNLVESVHNLANICCTSSYCPANLTLLIVPILFPSFTSVYFLYPQSFASADETCFYYNLCRNSYHKCSCMISHRLWW